jgi:hypothetical protein
VTRKTVFPEYQRQFAAGAGDAFVLFGIGRYESFATARPGDFVYFNRSSGPGHASVFIGYLDKEGQLVDSVADAAGFRYFSAQQLGTNGFGYRDAFFGSCPAVQTRYRRDCKLLRTDSRRLFSVSRLHDPAEWFTSYNAIRIERFFKAHDTIDRIYADEQSFRAAPRPTWRKPTAARASTARTWPPSLPPSPRNHP